MTTQDREAIEVRFDSGKDVLSSYWGYLSNGGLVIANDEALELGSSVSLRVHIASAKVDCTLAGRLIKRHLDGSRMVIAFDPGEPHDMLITEAISETDNVPARKHRRFRIHMPTTLRTESSGEVNAMIVNVSEGGMCIAFKGAPPAVGSQVSLSADGQYFEALVVWAGIYECGVRFASEGGEARALDLVHVYVSALQRQQQP